MMSGSIEIGKQTIEMKQMDMNIDEGIEKILHFRIMNTLMNPPMKNYLNIMKMLPNNWWMKLILILIMKWYTPLLVRIYTSILLWDLYRTHNIISLVLNENMGDYIPFPHPKYLLLIKIMERIDREWDNVGRILETRGRMGEARGNIIPPPDEEEDPYSFEWHPDPRKRKLYAAVLRDVVSDSIIGWDGVISVGDTQTSHVKGLDFINLTHAYDTTPFLQHLKETYGLLMNETHPIWARWEDIMIDKIKKWLTAKGIKLTDAGYEEPLWANNED
jgi:hypothetical protein